MEKNVVKMRVIGKRVYQFDKAKDIKRVEPCSVLLLSEVLASGVVPPDSTDMDFNGIEDPNNIAGRVTNVFDAVDASRELAKQGRTATKDSSVESASSAVNTSTSNTSSNSNVSSTASAE